MPRVQQHGAVRAARPVTRAPVSQPAVEAAPTLLEKVGVLGSAIGPALASLRRQEAQTRIFNSATEMTPSLLFTHAPQATR